MVVPGFTLDLGSLLVLLSTGMVGFIWRHLLGQIKQGDVHLEERIDRIETQHDRQQASIKDLGLMLQRIELQLTTLNTRFDSMAPKSRRTN